jgi:replicative DNA helicase
LAISDKMTAGLQRSDLVIVAARPSMGKTTFAMNLCEHAALTADKPVLIFSLEMPSEQIIMRMLASVGRIDQTKVRTGQLDDEDWARLSSTMGLLLEKGKMYIDDASGLTPTEVRPVPVGWRGSTAASRHDHGRLPAADAGAGAV